MSQVQTSQDSKTSKIAQNDELKQPKIKDNFLFEPRGLTQEQIDKIKPSYKKRFTDILSTIAKVSPEVHKALTREGVQFIVTDDVRLAVAENFGKDLGKGLDAVTMTPAVLSKGNPTPISKGSIVMLNSSIIHDPSKSEEYNVCNAISTILHEGFHLTQPTNAPKGQEIKLITQKEAELDAYSKQIQLLKALKNEWDKTNPKYGNAMQEVINKEEKLLTQWKNRN